MTRGGTNPRPIHGCWDELDVLTGSCWRRWYVWTNRSGATSTVKRRYRRRERREGLRTTRDELLAMYDEGVAS